jgi:hypothetical protein
LPEINVGRLQIGEVTLGGVAWPEQGEDARVGGIDELGRALVDSEQYVVPFEVASVLLLVAMVGAVYIVFPKRGALDRGEQSADMLTGLAEDAEGSGAED